jgi:dUTP pyrophosphatase
MEFINIEETGLKVKIKRLTETAKIPTRGSEYAAGYDLYADIQEPVTIPPHTTEKIPTGIATEIPHGYFGAVFPRSGLATKRSLNLINNVPVIDEDYRGEWFLPVHNEGVVAQTIEPGERIAQLILLPYQVLDFEEVDELSDTERGGGGFGSTGRT